MAVVRTNPNSKKFPKFPRTDVAPSICATPQRFEATKPPSIFKSEQYQPS